ncbi:HAD family hydrolase [Thermosipho atlanticus]|uniref:Beta-phosphoglucomutase n=1 Tax=Thermosipho atlanticus DSM 15807 TaxID=1123380 RepID=A0A1M5TBI9_9BACT|nr:beta-phosphoglucomutase family hydrolase [Thermosipho atlanticus]SHH47970.1 beta-phosphoglucomutase [Thermosipho atlanticus DSM 15807]
MLEAVIFDMDGVITDTVPLHFKAWKKMFEKHGYNFDFQTYKEKVDGKPRLDGIASVAVGVNKEELVKMAEEKQNYFLELVEKEPPKVFEDTLKLIKLLKENNIKIAVASSSKNTKVILENIGILNIFDAIVTGYDFKKGKPNPEIFQIAAERLNVKNSNCIVVEDSIEGVKAGNNAGMKTIGIARHGNESELSHANVVVSSLNEITIDFLKKLCSEEDEHDGK